MEASKLNSLNKIVKIPLFEEGKLNYMYVGAANFNNRYNNACMTIDVFDVFAKGIKFAYKCS